MREQDSIVLVLPHDVAQLGTCLADVLVAQHSIGVEGDFSAGRIGGRVLELEHVEEITVTGDVATQPARGGEGEIGDAVLGGKLDQLRGGCLTTAWQRGAART